MTDGHPAPECADSAPVRPALPLTPAHARRSLAPQRPCRRSGRCSDTPPPLRTREGAECRCWRAAELAQQHSAALCGSCPRPDRGRTARRRAAHSIRNGRAAATRGDAAETGSKMAREAHREAHREAERERERERDLQHRQHPVERRPLPFTLCLRHQPAHRPVQFSN